MHFDKEDEMGALTSLLWVVIYPIFGIVSATRRLLTGLFWGIGFVVAAPTARRVWASKIHVPLGERTADCDTSCSCSCTWGLAIVYWIGLVVGNLCAVLHSTAPTHGADFPLSYWAWNGYQSYEWILLGLVATNILFALTEVGRASSVRFFEERARRREQECIAATKAAEARLHQGLGAEQFDDGDMYDGQGIRAAKIRKPKSGLVGVCFTVVAILVTVFFAARVAHEDDKSERDKKAAASVMSAARQKPDLTIEDLRPYIGRKVLFYDNERRVIALISETNQRVDGYQYDELHFEPASYEILRNDLPFDTITFPEISVNWWTFAMKKYRQQTQGISLPAAPETPAVPATKKQVY